jgi:hypothetical protein
VGRRDLVPIKRYDILSEAIGTLVEEETNNEVEIIKRPDRGSSSTVPYTVT